MPETDTIEPNALLRVITQELYQENSMQKLRSINGIVSNINSVLKTDDVQLLYNEIKVRFVADPNYIEFYNHKHFEAYIINKAKSMGERMKARKT